MSMTHYEINGHALTSLKTSLQTKGVRILVVGPTGCGKTTLIRKAAADLGFNLVELNASASLKQIEDELRDISQNKTIEAFFSPAKKLLFMDDIDILMTSFPKLGSALVDWLSSTATSKSLDAVVLCVQAQEERRMTDIKKHTTLVRMTRPSTQACLAHFMAQTEGGRADIDDAQLLKLIKAHKNDLRAITMNLDQLSGGKAPEIDTLRSSFSELTLYDIQNKLFATPLTRENLKELVYTDSKLLGLLLYENVPREIQRNRAVKGVGTHTILEYLCRVSDAYIECDALETFMNINTCWDLMPIFNNIMLNTVNHVVHKWPRVSTPNTSFEFTPMMTKTALRYQFAKKKQSFLHRHGLSPAHFCDAMAIISRHMASSTPRESKLSIEKVAVDIAAKWGADYGIMTTARSTAWKKAARKKAKQALDDDNGNGDCDCEDDVDD